MQNMHTQDLGDFKIFRDGPRRLEIWNKMRYLKIYGLLRMRTRFKLWGALQNLARSFEISKD